MYLSLMKLSVTLHGGIYNTEGLSFPFCLSPSLFLSNLSVLGSLCNFLSCTPCHSLNDSAFPIAAHQNCMCVTSERVHTLKDIQCRAPAGEKQSMPYVMQSKYHHISGIKMIVAETIRKTWKDLHFFAISRERYSSLSIISHFKKLFVKNLRKQRTVLMAQICVLCGIRFPGYCLPSNFLISNRVVSQWPEHIYLRLTCSWLNTFYHYDKAAN